MRISPLLIVVAAIVGCIGWQVYLVLTSVALHVKAVL